MFKVGDRVLTKEVINVSEANGKIGTITKRYDSKRWEVKYNEEFINDDKEIVDNKWYVLEENMELTEDIERQETIKQLLTHFKDKDCNCEILTKEQIDVVVSLLERELEGK